MSDPIILLVEDNADDELLTLRASSARTATCESPWSSIASSTRPRAWAGTGSS
jgi:hypothetical protein